MSTDKEIREELLIGHPGEDPYKDTDDYDIEIEKEGNKLTLIPNRPTDDYGNVHHNNSLFMNDLYIMYSHEDGWTYIIDQSTRTISSFDGYWGSHLKDLKEGKKVEVEMQSLDNGDYKEYDFNI